MKTAKKKWALNEADVTWKGGGTSSGRRGRRDWRAGSITSAHLEFIHNLTGIKVAGEVPPGNYSRNEMRRLKADLSSRLLVELEIKVAKALRIKGR